MNLYRCLLLCVAFGLLSACGQSPNTNTPPSSNAATPAASSNTAVPSADPMAEGRKIYMAKCAACHKESGKGGKMEIEGKSIKPEDLTAEKIKAFPDDKLYKTVFSGIEDEGMPAFEDDLTEAEIREVVRYVRAEIQKMPLAEPTQRAGGVD
jgi:mono/diheme cytochrome c family protein